MRRLADAPAECRRLGGAARESVRARFSAGRLVSDVAALYTSALRGERGAVTSSPPHDAMTHLALLFAGAFGAALVPGAVVPMGRPPCGICRQPEGGPLAPAQDGAARRFRHRARRAGRSAGDRRRAVAVRHGGRGRRRYSSSVSPTISSRLRPSTKLVAEVALASGFVFFGYRLHWVDSLTLDAMLTLFWIVGVTNAFNLLDNMDGLCAGIGLIVAGALLSASIEPGRHGRAPRISCF